MTDEKRPGFVKFALLTPEMVLGMVARIDSISGDDEYAHSEEDKLHQLVLRAIAEDRCPEPAKCAAVALTTLALDFSRWCA